MSQHKHSVMIVKWHRWLHALFFLFSFFCYGLDSVSQHTFKQCQTLNSSCFLSYLWSHMHPVQSICNWVYDSTSLFFCHSQNIYMTFGRYFISSLFDQRYHDDMVWLWLPDLIITKSISNVDDLEYRANICVNRSVYRHPAVLQPPNFIM